MGRLALLDRSIAHGHDPGLGAIGRTVRATHDRHHEVKGFHAASPVPVSIDGARDLFLEMLPLAIRPAYMGR